MFEAACNGSGTANDNVVWTVTSDGTESTFENTKGIHYGTSKATVGYIELSTSGISGTITQVVVNASTASGVNATVGVTVGGNAFGGDAQSLTTSAEDYTFTGSASGAIVVRVAKPSAAAKALYVKSIEVTYTSSGGSGATYSVALEEGTKDAENWTGKVGEGNYGSLPLENVAEGAAVKLKYNGLRKVKSVTATTEASTGPVLVQSIELNYTGKMTIVGSNWLQIKTFRVLPANATDKSVTWSVDGTHISILGYSDDGSVRINGETPGTGWVKATANDGSGVSVTLEVEFKLN